MRHTGRFAGLAVALAVLLGAPATSAASPVVEVTNLTGEPIQETSIVEAVTWAKGRYQTAGLDLPDMAISFRKGRSNCSDMVGLWTRSDLGHRIEICVGGTRRRELVLIHEMAHSWVAEHLSDDDRDVFLRRRKIDTWTGDDTEWAHRGIEQACDHRRLGSRRDM